MLGGMEDAYYHTCGYPIIFEADEAGGEPRFHDGGGAEGQEPEIVETCPGCGEMLLLGDLTPEPIDEWW
jgi:hypothetical protein